MAEEIYGGGYYTRPHDANPGAYLDVYAPQGNIIDQSQFQATGLDVFKLPNYGILPPSKSAGTLAPPPSSLTSDATKIGNVNPYQIPDIGEAPMPQFPAIIEAAAGTEAPPTPAESQQKTLTNRVTDIYGKLFGKAGAQQEAETAQGIPAKSQAVTDIQSQINQLQNEAAQAMIEAQSRGETSTFGNAQIRQIERDRTVKALQLNSFLFAAQGNLATAQLNADKAIEAQFAPLEKELEFLTVFLDMNRDNLSREDKKKADQLEIQLNERNRLLEEQKAERTAINNIAIGAAEAGADASLLNKVSKAETVGEALQILASDPNMFQWAQQKATEVSTSEGTTVSSPQTNSVLNGISSLRTLTPSVRQDVERDLDSLGFGSNEPPQWFRDEMEQAAQQSLVPEFLKEMWIEYKKSILEEPSSGGGESDKNPISYENL